MTDNAAKDKDLPPPVTSTSSVVKEDPLSSAESARVGEGGERSSLKRPIGSVVVDNKESSSSGRVGEWADGMEGGGGKKAKGRPPLAGAGAGAVAGAGAGGGARGRGWSSVSSNGGEWHSDSDAAVRQWRSSGVVVWCSSVV
jgi:hypothetical protein